MPDQFEEWVKKMIMFTAFQLVVLLGIYAFYKFYRYARKEV